MTQRFYYDDGTPVWSWWGNPPADVDPDAPADDVHTIAHGYNLADLDRLSHVAARRTFGGYGTHSDRYVLAYEAMTELLLTTTEHPSSHELLSCASRAITNHQQKEERHYGYSRKRDTIRAGYCRYWNWSASITPSPERAVVERTALWQIWPRLSDRNRRSLLALAAAGDKHKAAEALGISPNTIKRHLRDARAAFLALWHEHEVPSKAPWKSRHATNKTKTHDHLGRPRLTADQVEQIRDRVASGETYAQIGADYGIGKSSVSRYMRGERRPVGRAS